MSRLVLRTIKMDDTNLGGAWFSPRKTDYIVGLYQLLLYPYPASFELQI